MLPQDNAMIAHEDLDFDSQIMQPDKIGSQLLPSDITSCLLPEDAALDFEDFLNNGGFEFEPEMAC